MADLRLIDIPGIGAATADRLEAAGVKDLAGLLALPVDSLAGFPGFHTQRAETVLTAARVLASSAAASVAGDPSALDHHAATTEGTKESKKHKKKSKKKDKKKSVAKGKKRPKNEEEGTKKDKKSKKKSKKKKKKKKKK